MRSLTLLLFLASIHAGRDLSAQSSQTSIEYRVAVNAADLSTLNVQMRITGAPAEFIVAAHAHPEYDDKYWRYLADMSAEAATVVRLDSVRWQVRNARGPVTLSYRIRLPAAEPPRAAWRAYLTPNGGLIGGPHSFLYVVGAESARATVQLALPAEWQAATALSRRTASSFEARDMFTLMESPIMVGRMREWTFDVARVPHRVFYLAGSKPVAFDSAAFVDGIKRLVEQSVRIFGSMPYNEYLFLIADDAYGGLEHPNSVTLGARSSELAENPLSLMREIAHEFFHTWNLMRIRPAEYRGVDYRVQPPVAGLWFSEGYSIFYSDLMRRRAGMIPEQPTRLAHLEELLGRYLNDPAYEKHSAEAISRVEYNSQPGALGNSDPSTHLIGEVLGNAIDLTVRAATKGARTSDDVMRAMNERFGTVGFTGADVERVVSDVCACNASPLFERYVRGAGHIDFTKLLAPLGLEPVVTRAPARNNEGAIERDWRIRAWQSSPQDTMRLMLWNEQSIWARAGLNTNDRILSINGTPVRSWPEFRTLIAAVPMGGLVKFALVRDGRPMEISLVMAGYDATRVELRPIANASSEQVRLRNAWLAGN